MKTTRVEIRVNEEEKERWTLAARRVGLTLSSWIRMVLKREVEG